MTLIELLVVLSILLLLAAIAVPSMRPALEGRRIREAARAINVYFGAARGEAMRTGRPVGVWIERWQTQPEGSIQLRQVETPPAYTGESLGDAVRVLDCSLRGVPPGPATYGFYAPAPSVVLKVLFLGAPPPNGLIHVQDKMQLNHQGPWFTIIDDAADANSFHADAAGWIDFSSGAWLTLMLQANEAGLGRLMDDLALAQGASLARGTIVPWPRYDAANLAALAPPAFSGSPEVPFAILRQPLPSSAAPLQLPVGTAIDLYESGPNNPPWFPGLASVGFQPVTANDSLPVVVVFSPDGRLDRVWYAGSMMSVTEPIYFLVGRADRLPLAASAVATSRGAPQNEDGLRNWQDTGNLWVSLVPQTGLVTAVENASLQGPLPNYDDPVQRLAALRNVRRLAQTAQSMGGR